MKDGSDAVADWAILNALVNTASGATWVSFHHGGGVGMGHSLHAGQVFVADGTDLAARKIERVLTTDPGMGVIRHADAGYDRAVEVAEERGVRVPMQSRSGSSRAQSGSLSARDANEVPPRARRGPTSRPKKSHVDRDRLPLGCQAIGRRAWTVKPWSLSSRTRVPPTSAARSRIDETRRPGSTRGRCGPRPGRRVTGSRCPPDPQLGLVGAAVAGGVGERLRRDPVRRGLDRRRKVGQRVGGVDRDTHRPSVGGPDGAGSLPEGRHGPSSSRAGGRMS